MPSPLHATLTEMFRHRPELAADLLSEVLGTEVPPHRDAVLGSGEVVALRATEHRADGVVLLRDGERTVGAVVVEIQLRANREKQWTWPLYVTSVRQRWRCPTFLLVVCPDPATARWAVDPIELGGPASRLTPAVLGPELIPVMTDAAAAARLPELSVLSALAHRDHPEAFAVLDVLANALASIDVDHAVDYAWLVLESLPRRARAHLEELMDTSTHEYQSHFTRKWRSEGRAEGRAEGEAEGRAAIVLRILANRGISVPDEARTRIHGCTDLERLELWSDRALTAVRVEDLFSG